MFSINELETIDIIDFGEFILSIIHDFMNNNPLIISDPKYETIIHEEVFEIVKNSYNSTVVEEISELISQNITNYFQTVGVLRSYPTSIIITTPDVEKLTTKLTYLQNVPQPAQKEDEWYLFRWNHLTASSIWKALEKSQCKQNELILNKCEPINLAKKKSININSPFHHGHKYEPLSTIFYEKMYNTKIGEFGCIKHKTIEYLAASPDGINIKKNNSRYGRLLEIKNIVNREINGRPKKEYWTQMQMQMECCDLDECDFLETRFKEYESEDDFEKDGSFTFTKEGKAKGIIVCFYTQNGPLYKYSPFQCSKEKYEKWYDNCIEENNNLTWVRNIFWYLDEHSCVLVTRNKNWFNSANPTFKKIWEIILKERTSGYEHRKPKKRIKKKSDPNLKNVVIKIRTQSFDNSQLIEPN